jgi:hypothetical protein
MEKELNISDSKAFRYTIMQSHSNFYVWGCHVHVQVTNIIIFINCHLMSPLKYQQVNIHRLLMATI